MNELRIVRILIRAFANALAELKTYEEEVKARNVGASEPKQV